MNKLTGNKKGQSIGGIVITAIGLIVALTLLVGGVTDGYGTLMNTLNIKNESLTVRSDQATTLQGKVITNFLAYNKTVANSQIAAGNFTVTDNVILADGTLGATIKATPTVNATLNNTLWNLTYTYQPLGYADTASRSVIPLILIFAGVAIAVYSLIPILKDNLLDIVS